MTVNVIVGMQWGDEGKGKITDYYARNAHAVVRYQGGNNAGHTIVRNGKKYSLHHLPSGVFEGKEIILGNGMVIDPKFLIDELNTIKKHGVEENLHISDNANVIMSYHIIQDELEENLRGGKKIGTTKKGIGPAYTDKVNRIGIRMADIIDRERLLKRIEYALIFKNRYLASLDSSFKPLNAEDITDEYFKYGTVLKKFVKDTRNYLYTLQEENKDILIEGAQGTFLDIDHGTYPFTTSSNTVTGNASTGTGIPFRDITKVTGILKAYTTRVGEGPFPTELKNNIGKYLMENGHEFGTTTGRMRRCGWLDLVMARTAAKMNSISEISLTKIDVLSGLDVLKVCTHYEYDGKKIKYFPSDVENLASCRPIYETLPGWKKMSSEDWKMVFEAGIPDFMKEYILLIERETGAKISLISYGPDREETYIVK